MMKNIKKYVSIVIVNFNGKHFLPNCLSSISRQQYSDYEIIIVDNGSKDGSSDFIKTMFPAITLIESSRNLGFAGGNNLGVQHAQGDLIVLLNNDTVVHDGWLQGLVDAVSNDTVAAASSLIKTQGIPERYYEKNGSVNFCGHNIMRVFDEPTDIFYAGGASMIFKKNILGIPFDEDYFVYAEDVYLGLRTRFLGYQVKHTNQSKLDHIGNGTAKTQRSEFLTYYQERNRLLNNFLFFSPLTILKIIPFLIINIFAKLVLSIAGRYSFYGLLHAYGWLLFHIPTILNKRLILLKEQKVNEHEVIRAMTGKMTNGESTVGRIINSVSLLYCRIVQLPVIELKK